MINQLGYLTTGVVQASINCANHSKLLTSLNSSKNPLIHFNLVVMIAEIFRCKYKESSGFSIKTFLFNYQMSNNLNVFTRQLFVKHFNSFDLRELDELNRNRRVIKFFIEDRFKFQFNERELSDEIQKDVFFDTVSEEDSIELEKRLMVIWETPLSETDFKNENKNLNIFNSLIN